MWWQSLGETLDIRVFNGMQSIDDTHPDARDVQIALLREAGVARRFALFCSMTDTAIYWSRRAIAKANPTLSQRELDNKFVAIHYGQDLVDRVKAYLEAKDS
jgi:hypothetical protein